MSEDSGADVAVADADGSSERTEHVVIELDRRTTTATYGTADTLLQTARSAGLQAPYSSTSRTVHVVYE